VHDDHVRRAFTAPAPNLVWLTDITEHATAEGKLYLCAILDVYSNRIVGYSIGPRMKASLAVAALRNAVALLQNNVLDRQRWTTRAELRLAIVSWIETTYHRRRRQRRLGKLTPIEFETLQPAAPAA
jgi:putative transposase